MLCSCCRASPTRTKPLHGNSLLSQGTDKTRQKPFSVSDTLQRQSLIPSRAHWLHRLDYSFGVMDFAFFLQPISKQEQNEDKSALTQGWQSIDIYGFLSPAVQQEGGIPQGCFLLQSCYLPSSCPAQGHSKERLQPPLPFRSITDPALPCPAQEPL